MTTKKFWFYAFALVGATVMLFGSCEKEDDKSVPVLTTTEVTEITQTTATAGGNITDDGGATVTARGVCWSTSQNPTISDSKTEDGTGTGSFTSSISGLEPNTLYFMRVYATNSVGTAYGNSIEFTTLEEVTTVTDIDGNEYTTIKIGTQEWMSQNLRTTKYNDGTPITHVTENSEWAVLSSEAYCWYENDEETYGNLYGALYNWYAVNTDGICPTGWHVPTDAEWLTLVDFAGGVDNAAAKLKATTEWNEGGNGTNEYGFSALPGGWRIHANGSFSDLGINGNWWSATEHDAGNARYRFMYYGDNKVNSTSWNKRAGFSVRCIRDN